MLGAVLLGLAGGSFAATPLLARSDRLLARLAALQVATAIAAPLMAIALVAAYRAGWHTTADVHVSIILAFAPAFLMGMSYPIGLHAWAARRDAEPGLDARRVGDLNSANLIGGIFGAIIGGFVILPLLGTRAGLGVLASVYLLSFFLLLKELVRPRVRVALAGGAVSVFLVTALAVPNLVDAATDRRHAGEQLLWWKEGAQTTAAVRVAPTGKRLLYLDGLHQASDAPDVF
jgi:hypothetical protein